MIGITKLRSYKGSDLTELAELVYDLEREDHEVVSCECSLKRKVGKRDWRWADDEPKFQRVFNNAMGALDWGKGEVMDWIAAQDAIQHGKVEGVRTTVRYIGCLRKIDISVFLKSN